MRAFARLAWPLGLALAAAPAAAQEVGDPPADETDEVIIVTALRRATTIDSTPGAVSGFESGEIAARSAVTVADLVNFVPNAMFDTTAPLSGSANSASVFIRGIGQTDFVFTTDSGVAVYLDGVYIARATGAALDLLDVQRVEVLRGPQGTLSGRNAIGGAIAVLTNPPDPGAAAAEA